MTTINRLETEPLIGIDVTDQSPPLPPRGFPPGRVRFSIRGADELVHAFVSGPAGIRTFMVCAKDGHWQPWGELPIRNIRHRTSTIPSELDALRAILNLCPETGEPQYVNNVDSDDEAFIIFTRGETRAWRHRIITEEIPITASSSTTDH